MRYLLRVVGVLLVLGAVTLVARSWLETGRAASGPAPAAKPKTKVALRTPVQLRVERRGNIVKVAFSNNGGKWVRLFQDQEFALPHKMKAGVIVETTATSTFEPVFDGFKLTPLTTQRR